MTISSLSVVQESIKYNLLFYQIYALSSPLAGVNDIVFYCRYGIFSARHINAHQV